MRAHPEGGWYAETWRAAATDGERPDGSAILYLLSAGERSHWHRLDADEVWQYSPVARSSCGSGPRARRRSRSIASVAMWPAVRPSRRWCRPVHGRRLERLGPGPLSDAS